jgi:ribose 5-phosphate isomerase A
MSQVDPATDPQVAFKRAAAWRAVAFVQSGMQLGLGTGSTAIYATRRIGEMLDSGELRDIVAFATSKGTLAEAVRLGIPMLPDDLPVDLDLTIDGADEAECHQRRRRRAAA